MQAAEYYREKLRAEVDGRAYTAPPPSADNRMMPRNKSFAGHRSTDWDDDWDNALPGHGGGSGDSMASVSNGNGGRPGSASRPGSEYTMSQLQASAAGKDDFFARQARAGSGEKGKYAELWGQTNPSLPRGEQLIAWRVCVSAHQRCPALPSLQVAANAAKPEGLPPSQGGKYVGFGSAPAPRPSGGHGAAPSVADVTQARTWAPDLLTCCSSQPRPACQLGMPLPSASGLSANRYWGPTRPPACLRADALQGLGHARPPGQRGGNHRQREGDGSSPVAAAE